jgi:general secretion pathway protein D
MNLGTFRLQRGTLAAAAVILLGTASAFAQGGGGGGRAGGGGGGGGGGGFIGGGTGGGGGGSANGNRSYQNATMVGDAMISSDVDTRRLIVVTDEATNENIKAIVASLDKPKPQVLINVVFMQVTHDDSFDLGAEATYKGPISIKTNPEGTATTKFGVADQLANSTVYGAFYQLVGRDVTATVHALSGVTKTEILSRPSILTRSNQQATILVGQSVPIVTGTQVAQTTGQVTNIITYQDVGIILRVTPFITAEGLVEMIVSPEISSLSATTVAVSNNINQPVIDKRSADTVVVTPSDRTIVIGGLISTQKNDTETKVPILGDIPILGYAFKHKNRDNVKTELLIFLTPHVVATPDELATLSTSERAKLNMAPEAFDKADIGKFLPGSKP